jgi:transposase
MYVDIVPNRSSPPAVLLRESYREDGKVKKRTVANISHLPTEQIEGIRQVLKGGRVGSPPLPDSFDIVRSRPHGHVAAVVGTLRKLSLERVLDSKPSRERDLVVAMIAGRLIEPLSKLAAARGLNSETLTSSLAEVIGVEDAQSNELYAAMDWLLERQQRIEDKLARRHLHDGALVLYDVSSTYFEGTTCPLGQLGHSRDGKTGTLQIVFGLLCSSEGVPVAVEVFEGNTGDPATVASQVKKLRERFALNRVVLVGDRGMLTSARIREDLKPQELDWISSLRAPAILKLMTQGDIQLSLFDDRNLVEIESSEFPGERLIACRNPMLAKKRKLKRQDLLEATERKLNQIVAATQRTKRPLRGKDKIGVRVGRVINHYKMGKHFVLEITDSSFSFQRDEERIAQEQALDGVYVIRTSVPCDELDADRAVAAYKSLAQVERAFRSAKTVDLKIRPIHHRLEGRVRAHVFLCMLAYYVEWHMRQALAPILFDDDDTESAKAQRQSPVEPAKRSPRAHQKAQSKRTAEDAPVHSFQTLLQDLATLTRNRVQPKAPGALPFDMDTRATAVQQRALDLLGVSQGL